MQIIAKLLLPITYLETLDYLVAPNLVLKIGDLVIAPLRDKFYTAIVWKLVEETEPLSSKLKTITDKAPQNFTVNLDNIRFIDKASKYYLSPLGAIAKLALPFDIAESPIKTKAQILPKSFNLSSLSEEQELNLLEIKSATKPVLMQGVTGSGKTEVYFHLIAEYLSQGKQVLLMLPEIALSSQIIKRFCERFGFEPVIWNSSITKSQKKIALRGILNGQVSMVIGTRSSLFLPYKNLELIIVDEEHDASYKQEESVLYNARDMAVLRASLSNIKILLCSATPSIETLYNISINKYTLTRLKDRYNYATLPIVKIIDMREEKLSANSWLSNTLIQAIGENLQKKEQTLLFLNRRGYAPLLLCKLCGYRFSCSSCSAWLVLHKNTERLKCHHCGYFCKHVTSTCPECLDKDSLVACGPGVERIEEEVRSIFHNYRIESISKDDVTNNKKMQTLLTRMENSEIDILIGTQMITKGYHFPNLTLVGIIDADLGLMGGDLRAGERSFQLLHQVSGRAGRGEKPGKVFLQTYYPEHILFSGITLNTDNKFIESEIENRRNGALPPFTKMASITISGRNELQTLHFAKQIISIAPKTNVRIIGPAKPLVYKLSNQYRYKILIIVERKFNLQQYLQVWISLLKIPSYYKLRIDFDPQSF